MTCAECKTELPEWALNDAGLCGHCIIDALRVDAAPVVTWDDVRAYRDRLLTRCDWTQAGDVPDAIKLKWQPVRATLRDLPADHDTPSSAMDALTILEGDAFA
jgi:hypothetical protein